MAHSRLHITHAFQNLILSDFYSKITCIHNRCQKNWNVFKLWTHKQTVPVSQRQTCKQPAWPETGPVWCRETRSLKHTDCNSQLHSSTCTVTFVMRAEKTEYCCFWNQETTQLWNTVDRWMWTEEYSLTDTHRAALHPQPAAQWGWGRSTEQRRCSWSDPICLDHMQSSSPAGGAAASSAPGRMRSRLIRWCSWGWENVFNILKKK